jgi:hypothetical protein
MQLDNQDLAAPANEELFKLETRWTCLEAKMTTLDFFFQVLYTINQ